MLKLELEQTNNDCALCNVVTKSHIVIVISLEHCTVHINIYHDSTACDGQTHRAMAYTTLAYSMLLNLVACSFSRFQLRCQTAAVTLACAV